MQDEGWCFTIFNGAEGITLPPVNDKVSYYVCQLEKCPDTGRIHLQGYMQFKSRRRYESVAEFWGVDCHAAPAYGSDIHNHAYCTKDDSRVGGPWEKGTRRPMPGRRAETKITLDDLINYCRENGVSRAYCDPKYQVLMLQYGKRLREMELEWIRADNNKVRSVEVTVIIGPPGSGKTPKAAELAGGWGALYRLPPCKDPIPWFDGYNGQKILLIDELKPEQYDWSWLLQILEGYPMQVPVKGAMVIPRWTKVYITSNFRIEQWYDGNKYDLRALRKRIHHQLFMDNNNIAPVGNNKLQGHVLNPGVPGL